MEQLAEPWPADVTAAEARAAAEAEAMSAMAAAAEPEAVPETPEEEPSPPRRRAADDLFEGKDFALSPTYARGLSEPAEPFAASAVFREWAAGRPLWQQDAMRRLAVAGKLTEADKAELTAFIHKENGLPVDAELPEMVPLAEGHLATGGKSGGFTTRVLGIRKVQHVGRMAAGAHLQFSRDGLTASRDQWGSQ